MCGENPPFWCEPMPGSSSPPGVYCQPPEHPAMSRAKQEFGLCDGGDNHCPPHVCTYHLRRREYFGKYTFSDYQVKMYIGEYRYFFPDNLGVIIVDFYPVGMIGQFLWLYCRKMWAKVLPGGMFSARQRPR